MLREFHDAAVYLMQDGKRGHILTPAGVGQHGGWGMVRLVPDGALTRNNIPQGPDVPDKP